MTKRAGFYRETYSSGAPADAPSVHDAVRDAGPRDEDSVVAYLESAEEIWTTMGAGRDAVTDDEWIAGAGSLLTDGTWLWPVDLVHYVRRHHAALPAEFLDHIRAGGYTVPVVSRERGLEIFHEEFPDAPARQPAAPSTSGGFLTWYVPKLTVAAAHRLLADLAKAGLPTLDPLTDDLFGFRETPGGTREPLPLKGGADALAAGMAEERWSRVEFTCWNGPGQPHAGVAHRTDRSAQSITLPLTGITGHRPEHLAAALGSICEQAPAGCLGYVADLTGATAAEDWDRIVLGTGGRVTVWPDTLAVLRERVPDHPELSAVHPTHHGPLAVFGAATG